jgi:hypothetical protein
MLYLDVLAQGKGFLPVMIPDRTTEIVSVINYLGYEISMKSPGPIL